MIGRNGLLTVSPHMNEPLEIKPRWLMWPFAEQLFTLLLFLSLGPGMYAGWLLSHQRWGAGLIVLLLWLLPYAYLLNLLHHHKVVRMAISVPCTVLILGGSFFLP